MLNINTKVDTLWTDTYFSFQMLFFSRRFFKDMPKAALDKKANLEFLEKDIGLKRFLPRNVIESMKVITKINVLFLEEIC